MVTNIEAFSSFFTVMIPVAFPSAISFNFVLYAIAFAPKRKGKGGKR
jgi:hypothetical protein